jgi:hypothetical protein
MADLSIIGPEPQSVKVGETATFEVKVSGGTEPYTYAWKKDGQAAPGAQSAAKYEIGSVTSESAGDYKVDVTDKDGKTVSSEAARLTVQQKEGELILWNQEFAVKALGIAAIVLAVLWLFFWIAAWRLLPENGQEATFSGFIAMAAVIVGVLAIIAGIYLAVLEYRGRARTIDEIKAIRDAEREVTRTEEELGITGVFDELFKVLPQSLKAFGDLKAAFATMLVGVILFICATAVAWKAAPENGGVTTPTTTGTQPPPPPPPGPPPSPSPPPPPPSG